MKPERKLQGGLGVEDASFSLTESAISNISQINEELLVDS